MENQELADDTAVILSKGCLATLRDKACDIHLHLREMVMQ